MYSMEQRKIAIETFIKFDHSYADTIAELGYPTRGALRIWWNEYKETGETPVGKGRHRKSKYSDEQARAAVAHYLEHGKCLARTMRMLGYPKGKETLCGWIDELAPGERKKRGPYQKREPVPIEKKVQVVAELEARTGPAAEVAEKHGVSRTAPYIWRREIMGDNSGEPEEKGEPVSKEFDDLLNSTVGTIQTSILTDIANAIRYQAGVATTYKPREMAAAVSALDGTDAGAIRPSPTSSCSRAC